MLKTIEYSRQAREELWKAVALAVIAIPAMDGVTAISLADDIVTAYDERDTLDFGAKGWPQE